MGPDIFFGIFDFEIFDFRVLPAAEIFMSSIFFREGLPMAGVDGACLRADFLVVSPFGASICFF